MIGKYPKDSHLALELTDFCNCSCIMCSQSAVAVIHGTKKGFIEEDLVKRLILDIEKANWKIHKFLPFALGESLLHPGFSDIMRYIFEINKKSKIFQTIDLHTNAILLNGDNARVLLDYSDQMDTLAFSLDAVEVDTYKKIRRNSQLLVAERNIEAFVRERKRRKLKRPRLHFQFIVMEENHKEAQAFLNRWKSFLDIEADGCQINYDWYPPMRKDTIFFKRLNPFHNSDIPAAEALHKRVAFELGLSRENSDERIIRSNEFVPKTQGGSASGAAGHGEGGPLASRIMAEQVGNNIEKSSWDKGVGENGEMPCDSEKSSWDKGMGHSLILPKEKISNVQDRNIDREQWKERRPCSGPWKFMNVSWDGEVTVCCIDTGRELSVGNLHEKGIIDLWNSEMTENYRLWHIRGEFDKMPKCMICRNLDSPSFSHEEVIEYLKFRGLEEDIRNYSRRFGL